MKKVLFFLAASAALVLAASCDRQDGPLSVREGSPVEVNVCINGVSTRATAINVEDEAKVNTLQVFVFNGNDREAYRSVENKSQALIPATSGTRTVWAVVNAPNLGPDPADETNQGVMTLTALEAAVSQLADNVREDADAGKHIDSFVMTGSVTQELTDGGNVPVTVRRIVSRISIGKVSTDFKDYRADYSIRLDSVFVINVPASAVYSVPQNPSEGAPVFTVADYSPASWANCLDHKDNAVDPLLFDRLENVVVRNGQPYETKHYFYPYPNPYGFNMANFVKNYSAEWSPRPSILCLAVTLFKGAEDTVGEKGYYPIELPVMERNKTYDIQEVIVTRLPGQTPFEPIETGETQVTITVKEWELGLNLGSISI